MAMMNDQNQAPNFKCQDCGRPVGARGTPWEPQPCFWCRRDKQQSDAARRRRESPRALAGVDVDAAAAWMLTLPVFVELIPKRKNGRKLQIDIGHRSAVRYNGRAWSTRFKIRICGGPEAVPAEILEVILHELVHIATPRAHHNERFRRVLQRAAREAWGVDVPIDVERGNENTKAYAMDRIIITKLKENGDLHTFPVTLVNKPSRAVATEALIEKRAAHAATMLSRAERKLKLAKTVQQRWAKKVRYYERAAALKKADLQPVGK